MNEFTDLQMNQSMKVQGYINIHHLHITTRYKQMKDTPSKQLQMLVK